jgi:hypothetical protein
MVGGLVTAERASDLEARLGECGFHWVEELNELVRVNLRVLKFLFAFSANNCPGGHG